MRGIGELRAAVVAGHRQFALSRRGIEAAVSDEVPDVIRMPGVLCDAQHAQERIGRAIRSDVNLGPADQLQPAERIAQQLGFMMDVQGMQVVGRADGHEDAQRCLVSDTWR